MSNIDEIDGEDLEYKRKAQSICQSSSLSKKESELYVLTEIADFTIRKAAETMNISEGNASGKRGKIKEKIQKAEKTAELNI